nr:MAG TPA: Baseplate J like protein [Caudoviricetes sp.]
MNVLSEYLQKYTYDYILTEALSKVPDNVDKREGSIIRDALSPCCYEAAKHILYLADIIEQTYIETANGLWLDGRVIEGGVTRDPATYAKKLGVFKTQLGEPCQISIGQSFSTVGDTILNYTAVQVYVNEDGDVVPGSYIMQCNTVGSVGNSYIGRIVPNDYIEKLASAEITTLLYPGEEEESDDSLRERFLANLMKTAFGGNIAQYRQWAKEIPGIGGVQVYPVWAGGGTVKLSIIDTDYNSCSSEFCQTILEKFDPENSGGETGLGLGIAPIGHKVTVSTPLPRTINVSGKITLLPGYKLETLLPQIKLALEEYLLSLRQAWENSDDENNYSVIVYLGRINFAILNVKGVSSAYELQLNGTDTDIRLTETSSLQEIPVLGTVSLDEQ